MSFSFFKKKKTPSELVHALNELLQSIPEKRRDPRAFERVSAFFAIFVDNLW